jgi:hypothetical protein
VDTPFWRHLTHPDGLTPPALPPFVSYTAGSVARVVVAAPARPWRTVTVGGGTLLLDALPGPVLERAAGLAARLARRAASADEAPRTIWEPSGDGRVDGGIRGRPSVLAALRLLSRG